MTTTMDRRSKRRQSSGGGVDRLSKLEDHVIGHILSFLPAKEAARAALLSPRWRDVFGSVHTVSMEEPAADLIDEEEVMNNASCRYCEPFADPDAPPPLPTIAPVPFPTIVTAALLGRHRRRGAVPLRGLRVAVNEYRVRQSPFLDQCLSYAVQQAGPTLDIDLLVWRRFQRSDRRQPQESDDDVPMQDKDEVANAPQDAGGYDSDESNMGCDTSDDETAQPSEPEAAAYYTVPGVLFTCATLRSLSLDCCLLALPANIRLPSLATLLLSNLYDQLGSKNVYDQQSQVQRLINGCPRLIDLTLESCTTGTPLSVLGPQQRLHRLALLCCCCHGPAAVAVDASQLRTFEYWGTVPHKSLLTLHGGAAMVKYCKVDINCLLESELVSKEEEELVNLMHLLQLFPNAEHLHLESARLGAGMNGNVLAGFPGWPMLRHLELRGRLPDDDTTAVSAVCRILGLTPNLEVLSLFFHHQEHERLSHVSNFNGEELLDAHCLRFNQHNVLTTPSDLIPCLSNVREINLVHYQGGSAQRTLAKFLLCNASAIKELWCSFAEGPFSTQTELMREIQGWVINKSAKTHFC